MRVIVTTKTGEHPGHLVGDNEDGTRYCVLDNGCQASFPAAAVRIVEDKTWPPANLETK